MSKIKIILYNDMAGETIARSYRVNNEKLANLLIKSINDTPKHIIKKVKENNDYLEKQSYIIASHIILENEIKTHKIWRNYARKSN